MGNGSTFMDAKFGKYKFVRHVVGVKVITKVNKNPKQPDNTPMFSNTANTMYAHVGGKEKKIVQISVYENHTKVKDIDWGHEHGKYKKGEVHVQEYIEKERQKEPRDPTEEEIMLVEAVRREDNE